MSKKLAAKQNYLFSKKDVPIGLFLPETDVDKNLGRDASMRVVALQGLLKRVMTSSAAKSGSPGGFFIPGPPFIDADEVIDAPERNDDDQVRSAEPSSTVERLTKKLDELILENQQIKSQLTAERRAIQTAHRNGESIEAHNGQLAEALRQLQGALIARDAGRLVMHEKHVGVVVDTEGDEVLVSYETDDEPIEQVYHREQFMHDKLPREGDRVEAHVLVSQAPEDSGKRRDAPSPEEMEEVFRVFREKGISGSVEL